MNIDFNKTRISKNLLLKTPTNCILKKESLKVGDFITLTYKYIDNNKEKQQFYSGVVIAIQNRSCSKTFTLRRTLHGVNIEYIFPFYSPNIISFKKKETFKIKRAKLYFLRLKNRNKLEGKNF